MKVFLVLWCLYCTQSEYDDVKMAQDTINNRLPFTSMEQCEVWFLDASDGWRRNRKIGLEHRCIKPGVD